MALALSTHSSAPPSLVNLQMTWAASHRVKFGVARSGAGEDAPDEASHRAAAAGLDRGAPGPASNGSAMTSQQGVGVADVGHRAGGGVDVTALEGRGVAGDVGAGRRGLGHPVGPRRAGLLVDGTRSVQAKRSSAFHGVAVPQAGHRDRRVDALAGAGVLEHGRARGRAGDVEAEVVPGVVGHAVLDQGQRGEAVGVAAELERLLAGRGVSALVEVEQEVVGVERRAARDVPGELVDHRPLPQVGRVEPGGGVAQVAGVAGGETGAQRGPPARPAVSLPLPGSTQGLFQRPRRYHAPRCRWRCCRRRPSARTACSRWSRWRRAARMAATPRSAAIMFSLKRGESALVMIEVPPSVTSPSRRDRG